jgi:hypothetical protein
MLRKKDSSSSKLGKGMQQITNFCSVKPRSKKNMGLASNQRKSAIKKAHEHKWKTKSSSPKKKQKKLNGTLAESRCDEGTKICTACEKIKLDSTWKRFAHHSTCEKNKHYKETDGGRISVLRVHMEKEDQKRLQNLKKPPQGSEIHSLKKNKITQEDIDDFQKPRKVPPLLPPADTGVEAQWTGGAYSVHQLMNRINNLVQNPTYQMQNATSVPLVVAAAIEMLCQMTSVRCQANSNKLMASNKSTKGYQTLQEYKKKFPPGTLGFTFPREDKMQKPDANYSQLEGRTIYMVRWELNIPDICLKCFDCDDGELISKQYDFDDV